MSGVQSPGPSMLLDIAVLVIGTKLDQTATLATVLQGTEVVFASPQEALALFSEPEREFAAALVDVSSPGSEGWEIAARIQELSACPILFLGAKSSDERLRQAYVRGVADFLSDPFLPEALRAKVAVFSRLLRQQREVHRHPAEEARKRAETILESITDAFYTVDEQWRFTYLNPGAARHFRRLPAELLGKVIWEEFPEYRGSMFENEYRRAVAEQTSVQFEAPAPLSASWVGVHAYPCAVGLSVYLRNITSRRAAEAALRNQEMQFRALIEKSYDAICVVSPEGVVLYVTPAIQRIVGYDVHEFLGMNSFDLAHPEDREWMLEQMSKLLRMPGGSLSAEYRLRHKDGRWLWIEGTATNLLNDPVIDGIVCNFRDITERKQAEDALEFALNGEKSARTEAEAANSAKDHFLAALSHELRTPLTPVLALLPTLKSDDRLSREAKEDLSMIQRNVELEARLINDLLDLTRIRRGRLRMEMGLADLHELIEHAIAIVRDKVATKGITLRAWLTATEHQVPGDPVRLQQVLWNVLSNAVKFTPDGGHIAIVSENPQPKLLQIRISDTGIGVPPEKLSKLFDAFSPTLAATSTSFGGLGVGLSISKAIVEQHGGTIRAESGGEGSGTTLTIELKSTGVTTPVATQPPGRAPEVKSSLRILLVEDHDNTLEVLARLLTKSGHRLQTASCVREARRCVERQRFDIVVSDIGLPDGSGLDLMRELRGRFGLKGIALSGFGMEDDIRRSHEAGFSEHLVKPVSFDRLTAALAEVMEMPEQGQ